MLVLEILIAFIVVPEQSDHVPLVRSRCVKRIVCPCDRETDRAGTSKLMVSVDQSKRSRLQ